MKRSQCSTISINRFYPSCAASQALNPGIDVELPNMRTPPTASHSRVPSDGEGVRTWSWSIWRSDSGYKRKSSSACSKNPYVDEGKVFETPAQRELAREITRKTMVFKTMDCCPFRNRSAAWQS